MSKNKGKFKKKFQEKLNEWLAETTSHGLPVYLFLFINKNLI